MSKASLTGLSVKEIPKGNFTKTVAVCNDNKACIDVLVHCEDGEVRSVEPLSDLKDFSKLENWTNPRNEKFVDLCK